MSKFFSFPRGSAVRASVGRRLNMGQARRGTPSSLDVLLVALMGVAYVVGRPNAVPSDRTFSTVLSAGKSKKEGGVHGYVVKTATGEFAFSQQRPEEAIAYGLFVDPVETPSNYGQLHVTTSGAFDDGDQMFAAGFIEGWLTAERIYDAFYNMDTYFQVNLNISLAEPMQWLQDQDDWVRDQIKTNCSDTFRALGLIYQQADGLRAGYAARQATIPDTIPVMTRDDFLFVYGNGDVYDAVEMMSLGVRPAYDNMTAAELGAAIGLAGHCSAIIKVTPDLSDILIGHSTWDTYSAALKIFKHYSFQLQWEAVAAQRVSFSSYPGELTSDDDLYMLSSGLVVISTTNHIYNHSIFALVDNKALLAWQRVLIANMLAKSGREYSDILAERNSGTYNNQYMIVDLNLFTPGKELPDGVLWVAEQIPGLVVSADVTDTLLRGYWPSFNVPYFREVFERSAYPDFMRQQSARGPDFAKAVASESYQLAPRAEIFRRDHNTITDLTSLQRVMRSNRYIEDPLSVGNPYFAVCARGDLIPGAPVAKGCYDSKVTSAELARELQADVVCSMTTEEGMLPPFTWGKHFEDIPHKGLATKFNFNKFERQAARFPDDWLTASSASQVA